MHARLPVARAFVLFLTLLISISFLCKYGTAYPVLDARMEFWVGGQPWYGLAKDLDGDACLDAIVANFSSDDVSVLFGNCDGTFGPAEYYTAGDGPRSLAMDELNGDACLDLAVANYNSDNVSVLFGDCTGAFSFTPPTSYDTGDGATSVATGDFNEDGCQDLIVANEIGDSVSLLLNNCNGTGTFQPAQTFPVGDVPRSLAVDDFDDDGCLDSVVANVNGDSVSVLLGTCAGSFDITTLSGVGNGPNSLTIEDFDEDGCPDLAVSILNSDTVSVLLGGCDGAFAKLGEVATGDQPHSVSSADMDGDGCLDLAVANLYSDDISVLLGGCDGSFQAALNYGAWDQPRALMAADFNKDGYPDLAVSNTISNKMSLLTNRGDGTFPDIANYTVGDSPCAVAIGEVNGDPCVDLVTANRTTDLVRLLVGGCDGSFQLSPVSYGVGDEPSSIAVGDLDGDECQDVVVANRRSDEISVLGNYCDGFFRAAENYPAGDYPVSLALGNLDLDPAGCLDAVVTNEYIGEVSLLLGNCDQTFQARVAYETGSSPRSVTIGDLNTNTDACPDLVVANFGGDDVSVLLSNCDGTFQSATHFVAGNGPSSVQISNLDLDPNGCMDLVVSNELDDNVSILLGNCDGTFELAQHYEAGDRPGSVTVGDFDGDGTPDLVVANNPSDHVSLLLGNTGGVYPKAVSLGAKDGPISIAARDLNGDDLPDIAVANYNSDDVVVMLALVAGPCNDGDGDGYGDPSSPECAYPHRDCDDVDPDVNPGVDEDCNNEKDDDCDGFVDGDDPDCNQECIDSDGDGFGDPGSPSCEGGSQTDCDDSYRFTYPGAQERCDQLDNQCPGDLGYGQIDENGVCDSTCAASAAASSLGSSPVYEVSDLGKHLAYFLLPVGVVMWVMSWRRKR